MKNSKLIFILKTFTQQDWKEFKKWSRCCYDAGSTGEKVIEIISTIPNFKVIKSNFELIERINSHPDVKIKKRSLANSLTGLTDNLDIFLISKEINNNDQLKSAILIDSYTNRGLTSLFKSAKQNQVEDIDNNIWSNYYRIKTEYSDYFKGFYENYSESKVGLESFISSLLLFHKDISDFIILEMTNRSIVLGEDWEESISKLQAENGVKTKFTHLFEMVIAMRKDNDERAYQYLRKKIIDKDKIPMEIVEVLMVHITSYLNLRFKRGEYELADDVLEFYSIGVSNGYYLTDGKMSPRRFLNIVNTACSLEKQKWANSFTENYKHLLENKFRKSVISLCQAAISFADKDFLSVSKQLQSSRFSDFDMEFRARLLKLQSNLELEKENLSYIIDEITSFKYYINRNQSKLNLATIKGTKTLLKYVERIINGKVDNIKEDLQKEKYIMLGRWLNKVIDEVV